MSRSTGAFAPQWRTTSIGIAVAISLFAFEAMAVATAMPVAVRDLGGLAFYGWPFSVFLVCNVLGLVLAGRWGDRVGPRAPLVSGIAVFVLGLVVAGTAGAMVPFVLGRGLQGFGVGLATVGVFLIVATAYPQEVQPKAMAVVSTAYVLPAFVGPLVSGSLTTYVSWRWVFLGLVPLILAGLALLLPVLRRLPVPDREVPQDRGRVLYALLAGVGAVLLQYGAGTAVDGGAGPGSAVALLLGAPLLGWGLHRLLPSGVWRLRAGVPAVVGQRGLLAGAFYAVESAVPLALVSLHGYSPMVAGLPLLSGAIGWWLGAQLQGRSQTASREALIRRGFLALLVCVAGIGLLSLPGAPGWPTYLVWACGGLGMGLGVPSTGVLILALSPEGTEGANSSALQIADVIAAALCISFGGVLIGAAEHGAFTLSTALALLCAAMSLIALTGTLTTTPDRAKTAVAQR